MAFSLFQSARTLWRHRGFAATAVVTMALGIGLNTAVFSLVNALLLRPPPVTAPNELVHVYSSIPGGFLRQAPMAFPDFEDLEERARSFSDLNAYAWFPLALDRDGGAELVMAELVTGGYFSMLGVVPQKGRLFGAEEDGSGRQPVVVLSHDAWQRSFAGASDIVGRELQLNGRVFVVVGVAPPGFHGLIAGFTPDLWMPMQTGSTLPVGVTIDLGKRTPGLDRLEDRGRSWVWVTGRLQPGVAPEAAAAEVAALGDLLAHDHPTTNEHRSLTAVAASSVRLLPGIDRALRAGSLVVLAVFGLALILAAINLAGLFLARALARQREIATRLALGAGRRQLVAQLFVEGLILAALGGALGLLLAAGSNALLSRLELPLEWPIRLAVGSVLDLRILLFSLVVAVSTAVVFALVPALEATRLDLVNQLRDLGASASRPQRRLRGVLVGVQVAVSALLLAGAGLALQSLLAASRVDPGFDPREVAVTSLSPGLVGYEADELETYFRRLHDEVSALPGVESATLASHLPLTFAVNFATVSAEGEEPEAETWPAADTASVGPGYFETLRIELLDGRGIEPRDDGGAPLVAVVNQTLARRLWPGETAVGRRLRVGGIDDAYTVVGVAADGKYRTLGEPPRPFFYRSLEQDPRGTRTLVVRGTSDLRTLLPAIREAARRLDPRVPVARPTSFDEALAGALFLPRAAAVLLAAFGVLGALLSAVGIYGVVAFMAQGRRREVGVRMALGAGRGRIVGWLLGRGLRPVAVGLVAGLLAAAASSRLLAGWFYGLHPIDLPILFGVAALLVAVALAASYLPARRAAGLEPSDALRHE